MMKSMIVRLPAAASGPSTVESSQKDVDLELWYNSPSKHRRTEPSVIFLPFWGGSASTFEQVMAHLGHLRPAVPAVAVSYAGTGRTPAPANDGPEAHSIMPRAEQLLRLLKTEDAKNLLPSQGIIICAHSMSAKIAYSLLNMLATDETVNVEVLALLLIGPAPIAPLVLPPEMRQQQLQAYETVESARWTIEHVLSNKKLDGEILRKLAEDAVGMSPGAKEGWLKHGMAFDCAGYMDGIRKRWPELMVTVLVGEVDMVETVDRVKQQTINALRERGFQVECKVIDGCGHLLPVEAADEVVQAMMDTL